LWSDNETHNDFLNYSETAELLAEILEREDLRPVSLGVFGGWGAGKTSLIRMVQERLHRAPGAPFIVVEFDAWLFQDFDDARAALLERIGRTLYREAEAHEGLRDKVSSLLKRVNKLRILGLIAEGSAAFAGAPTFGFLSRSIEGLQDIAAGEGDQADIEAVTGAVQEGRKKAAGLLREKEIKTPPQEIEAFRAELQVILEQLNKTLVVFIDNLDRCLPRNAILTLEAVRLFFFWSGPLS
jgi:predicted KAP-like P-loop ATPase